MKLRSIDIILLLLIGTLMVGRSVWGIFKDLNIDISKSKYVFGKVSEAGIKKIEANTIKLRKYKTVFVIKLDNSNQYFAVDRGRSICNFLNAHIRTGDSIKIYYRSKSSDYNRFVFQIEKNNTVLINYKDYTKKESRMIIFALPFGVLIIIGTIFWARKQK